MREAMQGSGYASKASYSKAVWGVRIMTKGAQPVGGEEENAVLILPSYRRGSSSEAAPA